ncbi:TPM domain-containing protein [Herbaspirillum rubrisubalbicans]|uniref:TPM domain-containing protein n=1 Tax=Herbaspirillum rubrisubalbicans TaxID=80842 RepID=UPI0015592C72|nr:TPM domain-containing protein [Herbaspirillum rubrisubalbicans]NQE48110.1 signal peptide protein [Herbaspirillum rubrisubalbicans]
MAHNNTSPSLLARLLRHLRMSRAAARRAFPSSTLKAIQASIGAGEQTHRAQVRVIVEAALSLGAVRRGETARQRAHELFARYRIWDTEENCGVLVYLNLADRKVEIIADRGISARVSREQWQQLCRTMTAGYADGHYERSTLQALADLHDILRTVLPRGNDTDGKVTNELSDKPLLL